MSSWWESIQSVAAQVVESTQSGITNLTSYPETATCTQCHVTTAVPASAFAWTCKNGHQNTPLDYTKCTQCEGTKKEAKQLGLYVPQIMCSNPPCAKPILLSETAIANTLWTSMVTAPHHVEKAVNTAVESAKELTRPPTIFTCKYCSAQLYTPTGPWTCYFDNCNTQNLANTYECSTCKIGRYSSGVTCSICHRSTPVPSVKFISEVESAISNVQTFATSTYKYVDGSTTAPCYTCHFPIQLDKEQVRLILGVAPGSPVPGFDEMPQAQTGGTAAKASTDGPKDANEEEIFAALNEEEKPLASNTSPQPSSNEPTPQDVLCQKCLHMNSIGKDQLVSRKITKQVAPVQPPTQEELDQQAQQQIKTQHSLQLKHVDENGQPICCVSCQSNSTMLKPVIGCTTCHLPYCRKCAPYTRNSTLYCYGCATAYDNEAMQRQQQEAGESQEPQQQDDVQQSSPQASPAQANPPAPADPYDSLQ